MQTTTDNLTLSTIEIAVTTVGQYNVQLLLDSGKMYIAVSYNDINKELYITEDINEYKNICSDIIQTVIYDSGYID